jgi:hypothetical protein
VPSLAQNPAHFLATESGTSPPTPKYGYARSTPCNRPACTGAAQVDGVIHLAFGSDFSSRVALDLPFRNPRVRRRHGRKTACMTSRLVLIALRQVLRLLLFSCRSSRSKNLELLVLRQELAVLRRQVPHPKTRRDGLTPLTWRSSPFRIIQPE